jgi:hypothetical protein
MLQNGIEIELFFFLSLSHSHLQIDRNIRKTEDKHVPSDYLGWSDVTPIVLKQ